MLEPRRVFQRLIVPPVSLGTSKRTSLVAKAETRVLHQHVLSLSLSISTSLGPRQSPCYLLLGLLVPTFVTG